MKLFVLFMSILSFGAHAYLSDSDIITAIDLEIKSKRQQLSSFHLQDAIARQARVGKFSDPIPTTCSIREDMFNL